MKKVLLYLALIAIGSFSSPAQVVDLTNMNTNVGFSIIDDTIHAMAYAGDINADGYNDFMLYGGDGLRVVYGSKTRPSQMTVSDLSSSQTFSIGGINLQMGYTFRGIGDVNGDNIDDLITANADDAPGNVCVIFGSKEDLSDIDIDDCSDETFGIRIKGCNSTFSYCNTMGNAVSGAGDINGDGIQDMIMSNYQAGGDSGQAGVVYVVYGNKNGLSNIDLSQLNNTQGFSILGVDGSQLGYSMAAAGDVNGDGVDDIILSSYYKDVYVIYGNKNGLPNLNMSNLQSTQGFTISSGLKLNGWQIDSAGDFNGDGIDDLLVVVLSNGSPSSKAYVIYGNKTGFSNISLSNITQTQGVAITIDTTELTFGGTANGVGDVNQDGLDDVLVTTLDDTNNIGVGYVVFGTKDAPANISLANLTETQGYQITGSDEDYELGSSGAGLGDIDGDGYPDIALATLSQSPSAYVVYSPFAPPGPKPKFGERIAGKALIMSMIAFIICLF